MQRAWMLPILGVAAAVIITATMDATGYFMFSALPLFPLMAIFWWIDRLSLREIGFATGRPSDHAIAIAYPVLVMGSIALAALLGGALDPSQVDWSKASRNVALVTVSTIIVAIITEEGFFRGWLWGSLNRRGVSPRAILLWTSLAFAAWHIAPISLSTGFDVPAGQIPVYLVNATALGAIWGLLRGVSGSILVASVCHGVWNGLAYVLFGFGTQEGALGIANTAFYGPEVGLLGLAMNLAALALLWWWGKDRLDGQAKRRG